MRTFTTTELAEQIKNLESRLCAIENVLAEDLADASAETDVIENTEENEDGPSPKKKGKTKAPAAD